MSRVAGRNRRVVGAALYGHPAPPREDENSVDSTVDSAVFGVVIESKV